MKKIHFILGIIIYLIFTLSSCTTYKPYMSQASNNSIPEKLPKMPIEWTNSGNVIGGQPDFIKTIVINEINTNVINNNNHSSLGKLEVKLDKFHLKQNLGLAFVSGLTLFSLNLLGMPIGSGKVDLDLTFNIYDANHSLIKTYYYSRNQKSAIGFYYGKDVSVLACEVTKSIIEQFKKDVTSDYSAIKVKLEQSNTNTVVVNSNNNVVAQVPEVSSKKQIVSDVDNNIPQCKSTAVNTYALIIANEEYQFVDNVNFAMHDGETFKEYCIKTLGIPERQIRFCPNASYGIISGGVDWLKYALDNFEGSKGIVYYCGHGIPDEKSGEAFIVPVDGKGTNTTTCYSLNTLYKTLAETKAANVTYFMDACFTGANKEGSMLVAARGVAREPAKATVGGNSVVFSASSSDETAMTYPEKGHGLFTYFLLKKLQETGGDVSYSELSKYINSNVKKEAFLINEKPQTPVVATSPEAQENWKEMKLK